MEKQTHPPAGPPDDRTVAYTGSSTDGTSEATFSVDPNLGSAPTTYDNLLGGETPSPASTSPTVLAPEANADADAAQLIKGDIPKRANQPVILGDFSIVQKLGQGGMGAVFKAKQLSLDRDVALKVLARHLVDNKEFVARFYREAQVMAKLEHPHIIHCYGVGEAHGLHYLAMEYVDGGSLQSWLDKLGRLSVGDALLVTIAAAEALDHAHELNLVHRDIKPDNVLITKRGVVKIADLGLAKPMGDDLSLTQSGVGAGTPHYMAPEQMRNARDVDGRADIYALGAMLYVMLTGEKPFRGTSLVELIKEKETGRFTPARRINPEVPERLDLMIDKMLAKNLTARYQKCHEIIQDLESLGLAHTTLSFIEGAASPKSVRMRVAPAVRAAAPAKPSVPDKPPATSGKIPGGGKATAAEGNEIWYVTTSMEGGKRKVKKMTTNDIIQAIKNREIDSRMEASRQINAGYRAIASHSEFEYHCRSEIAKLKADKKSGKLKEFFENIEEEQKSYERWRWISNLFRGFVGWIILLCVLAAVGAGIVAAVMFGPNLFELIAKWLGLK